MTTLFSELKRRNVIRVGIAYVVVSWLVLQVLDLVLENIGAPPWVMKSIMAMLALGLPIALLFAWAFEMTPEGLKRESEVDRSSSITGKTGRKLDRLIIVFLVAVVVVMGLERTWFADSRSAEDGQMGEVAAVAATEDAHSIAVLPFADLSETQDQAWFGDGLSEEILNALMRTPDLLVASRTSSFKYKGSDKDIREIGTELGVMNVLEGSVRRSGDKIRVTAQLIRVADGFHVWSQNYDREMKDVISIQEDLAIEIARALETSMDPIALASMMQAGTRSIEAYQHYLNSLALEARATSTGNIELFKQAYEAIEQARSVDPGFAAAHEISASFWDEQLRKVSRWNLGSNESSHVHRRNFEVRIRAAIEHAADPISRKFYEAKLAVTRLELRRTIELLKEVIASRPNVEDAWDILMRSAAFLQDLETLQFARDQALILGRVNPDIGALASMSSFVLQSPEAGDAARTVLGFHPYHREVVYQSHRALLTAGDVEEASRLVPLMVDDGWYLTARTRQACAEGDRELAERLAKDSEAISTSGNWHANMLLGYHDKAAEVIREMTSTEDLYVAANWLLYPHFDPTPFPDLVAVLEREDAERGIPVKLPYFCPPRD
jgi:TolB-like protein